jgi:hypothetical protein
MPLSRRYSPEWYPGESASIGIDMSNIIPPGVGIASGQLAILTNTVPPVSAQADFTGPPGEGTFFAASVIGRALYTTISGGASGRDYIFVWEMTDTDGNHWNRAALLLCAPTS